MRNPVIHIIILSLLVLVACDNGRQVDGNQNEGTTDTLSENLNAEGNSMISQDTTLPGPVHTRIVAELPGPVVKEILTDPDLRNQVLVNNRSFEENGETYYELTFDNQTQVTFDNRGNRNSLQ